MDYSATLDYIDSFINFERIPQYNYASSFNLERVYAFLKALGAPHKGLKTIHVAGSKGKGSTCVIVASILREAGYRVGLYTSPHLLDVRERIRVGDIIEEKDFIRLIEKIEPIAEKFRDRGLSFFEVFTACAFLYFKEKRVDLAVLETGLGGRLDATNVTEPVVCGITSISSEHTDKLGSSLEAIAREKAGIIKVQGMVVSAWQRKEVRDVIREVCREKNANLYEIGRGIIYSITESNEYGQRFSLEAPGYLYKDLELNLLGAHQVENATLAIAMLKSCIDIDERDIRSGLKNVSWPGRLQVIRRNPYIVLDGAQNTASIRAILSSVKEFFHYKRLICIFGIMKDKDIQGVSRELDMASDIVILTKSRNGRAKDPLCLKENFSRSQLELRTNIEDAITRALDIADTSDLILITGSLYIIADALKVLNK